MDTGTLALQLKRGSGFFGFTFAPFARCIDRDQNCNLGAPAFGALNAECAFNQFRSFAHVDHAEAAALIVIRIDGAHVEADAVILDFNHHVRFTPVKPHDDLFGLSVFAGVITK